MKLLDTLIEKYSLKNDAEIARRLEVAPPVISRIRNGKIPPSSDIILRVHEKLGMPVADIRACL
jgi:transcriptional regulator with XRE-family HTH domain